LQPTQRTTARSLRTSKPGLKVVSKPSKVMASLHRGQATTAGGATFGKAMAVLANG